MAVPWLPDTCLTSQRAAEGVTRVIDQWADAWFARNPWQTLGGWDEAPVASLQDFALLSRVNGMEIRGKDEAMTTLGLAIMGLREEDAETQQDTDFLHALAVQALEDLEERVSGILPSHRSTGVDAVSSAFPRVFSILVGTLGHAQLAIECSLADLVALTREAYAPLAPSQTLSSREEARQGVSLDVSVSLGTASVSLKELGELELGDLIVLETTPAEPAKLRVGNLTTDLNVEIRQADDSCVLEFQG